MASEAAVGALVSNHSYGYRRGWSWGIWYGNERISNEEDYLFGFYGSQARDWDQIGYDAPYYLIVKSAGNDRDEGPTDGQYPPDGPYDCIGNAGGISKNVLTVGAVEDIPGGYSGPSSVVMSSFSSWGPADDGRIKPDIVANGIELYSTDDDSDTDYAIFSGTSMAAPSAAGSLILLQSHWEDKNGAGNYMLAATLKALAIATADEAGTNPGPDYSFGWGLMNTEAAAKIISENQTTNVIDELVLSNGGTYSRTIHSDGSGPIKITICWTDKPGTPVAASLDPGDPMLVNDLDLTVSFGGNTFYPWKLDRINHTAAATNNSKNYVDNVEVVYIANPTEGDYTITVDHDGTLDGGLQAFSIIYCGVQEIISVAPVAEFEADNLSIFTTLPVHFSDLSSGNPDEWLWTFTGGNPATSTEKNPTVTYANVGTYTVELMAKNSLGTSTETKIDYITVSVHPPVADFTSDITTVLIGESVIFTDQSTFNPATWEWTFAGGTPATSTEQNPTVTYNTVGIYDVSLTVTNQYGTDTETVTGYIIVAYSLLDYCESYSQDFSEEYISRVVVGNLDNSSGGSAYSDYTTTGPVFNALAGTNYTISLTPWKARNSYKESWRVWIDYNANGDFTDAGELVFAIDLQRKPVSGNFTIPSGVSGSTRMRIVMNWNTTSISSCGMKSQGEVEDYTVSFSAPVPQPPVADFTANTTSVVEGNSVNFTDLSANDPTSWSWTFTGGTPGTSIAQNPTVTYNTIGNYDVSLIAKNAQGSDAVTKVNYITVTEAGTYCSSQSNSNAKEWIAQVVVGGINNSSGASTYTDFTSISTNLTPGATYSVSLTPYYTGKAQREFWRIWIDYNGDGDFTDTDETVFTANNKKGAVSGTINIPSNVSGLTRMRVSMKRGSSPSPCELFTGGEVEDYTVNITSSPQKAAGRSDAELLNDIPDIDELAIKIDQNYPNPFNNLTEIQYFLSKGAFTKLTLMNMNGKTIANLIDKYVKGSWHTLIVNGSGLASGAYVLVLEADGKAATMLIHKTK